MNYMLYRPVDVVNGEGVRSVLFLSGCSHGCKGCYNESAWNPKSGHKFTLELENTIIKDLKGNKRRGITFTGGDPLFKNNYKEVLCLCKRIKSECADKSIWMYTGYTYKEVQEKFFEILKYIDVLVDGKFEQNLYDPSLKFRGSSNQNIIKIQEA